MSTNLNKISIVALTLALMPIASNAAEIAGATVGPNGHFYKVVEIATGDKSWATADSAAKSWTLGGVTGHLATINTPEEQVFLAETWSPASGQTWIGGFQVPTAPVGVGKDWFWVDDGNGVTAITAFYWAGGEPNDGGGDNVEDNQENHLTIGRFGDVFWNDEGVAVGSMESYIVEFSGTVEAVNCLPGSGIVCNPSGAQIVELPEDIDLPTGATISQSLLAFPPYPSGLPTIGCTGDFARRDPRVDINGRVMAAEQLDVFAVFGPVGDNVAGDLILPANLFGSPCFAVVKGGANFDLTPALTNGGVVNAQQFPEAVPGIGNTFDCLSSPANPDLRLTTQFGYQTDDRFDMVEEAGAAMTKSCNSPSRAGTVRFSYFVLNTHEDCGGIGTLDYNAPGARDAIQQCFIDFAVDHFDAVDQVLYGAKTNLIKPKFSKLSSKLNQARSMTKTGQFSRSNKRLETLLTLVENAEWDISNGKNEPGNLIMRINNLIFRNEQLEEAASF